MNYFKTSISYYFKNFWFLMLFAVVPAVFVGLLLQPFRFIEFLFNYPFLDLAGFPDFFFGIVPFDWVTILLSVLGTFLIAVFMSMLLGKIEAHFRIGKKGLSFKDNTFNNNFASVVLVVFIIAICYFVIAILSALFVMLFDFIFAKHGLVVISTILNYVIGFFALAIISCITTYFGVVASDMMIMGSNFRVAMSSASQAINKNTWQNLFVGLIPFLISAILSIFGTWLNILWLTNIISMLLILPFMCVLVMIIFFNHYGITRYDTRPYYNLK